MMNDEPDFVELELSVVGGRCVACFTTRANLEAWIAGTDDQLPLWMRAEDSTLASTLLDVVCDPHVSKEDLCK